MLSILDMLLNSLSMAIDTRKTKQGRDMMFALWAVVFLIAFVVANVT